MPGAVHDVDQYMADLRTIIGGGRKRLAFLFGAGTSAGMKKTDGSYPLIPAVAALTDEVLSALDKDYGHQFAAIKAEIAPKNDIETILSRTRSLGEVIGGSVVNGLDGPGYREMSKSICRKIALIVQVDLPFGANAYTDIVNWIIGIPRDNPIEIFTTNYDLLIEQALERARVPYFDGFSGCHQPFFDPTSVSQNNLPARWTRLWKLHGSLGWKTNDRDEVIRVSGASADHLIFPEHQKYDQTQKAPYSSYLDRLRDFLAAGDCLLISCGFSFADAHIAARVRDGLSANPSSSLFAFQYGPLNPAAPAAMIAKQVPNFSLYARDQAIINTAQGAWRVPEESRAKDWGYIRNLYWRQNAAGEPYKFALGSFEDFATFFSAARSEQVRGAVPAAQIPELIS
jgi:hypothetical protein